MESAEVLALIGGHVEKEILLRNEYLAAENEILKSKLEGRPRLNDEERVRLAKIGEQLGRKALGEIGTIVKPDTILKWFRDLVAKKFDGSKKRSYPGRPRVDFYRYDVGQQFDWHYDGCYERPNGERSWLTFMIYLNGDFDGGQTAFENAAVEPDTGMALFFVHQVLHKGQPVTNGRKYVLRSDVMYRFNAR